MCSSDLETRRLHVIFDQPAVIGDHGVAIELPLARTGGAIYGADYLLGEYLVPEHEAGGTPAAMAAYGMLLTHGSHSFHEIGRAVCRERV